MNNDNYISMGKNLQILIDATELYTTLMVFLMEMRGYKTLDLKIGTFEYDEWKCDLFCHIRDDEMYFTEENHSLIYLSIDKKYKTLTDLCFGDEFFNAVIDIDFDFIDNYQSILNSKDQNVFDEMLADTKALFW